MEVKVILEENKTEFEKQLKECLEQGYKIQTSNITTYSKKSTHQEQILSGYTKTKSNHDISMVFYALMIKN